jgi:enamine deaminase RidA (YjgF/YER057c/UK114 family)
MKFCLFCITGMLNTLIYRTSNIKLSHCATHSIFLRNMASKVESKISELHYKLPTPNKPVASYVMYRRLGNIIYTSGHLPQPADGPLITGKVGADLTTEQGYDAARAVMLNILATVKSDVGDLDKIKSIVKLTAFVNCMDGFTAQPKVANGASELCLELFGESGKHARSAVGVNALPLNVPVEIEAIIELH